MYFDEVHFVAGARGIASLSAYSETTHPPLGPILIAAALRFMGDHPGVWRLPSLLCSLGSLGLIERICLALTHKRSLGWATIILLSLDGLWMTQARIGLLNAPMLFFMLLSLWFVCKDWINGKQNKTRAWTLAGISAGLAICTKWSGASILIVIGVWGYFFFQKKPISMKQVKEISLSWILLPSAVYFAGFLIIPFIQDFHWRDIWELQKLIPGHHLHLEGIFHRYTSSWWTWPFLFRPIWYGFNAHHPSALPSEQVIDGILCIGNPAIFWMIPLAIGFTCWQFKKNQRPFEGLILIGFFVEWLQSACVPRYTMFHHFYPALPFAVMSIASLLAHLWNQGKWGPLIVGAYLGAVVVMFIYWYPLWTGLPISYAYYQHHLWFPSWK